MMKKHCLFCNELVEMATEEDYNRFTECMCAPGAFYRLHRGAYTAVQSFSYAKKRQLLPLVSGYIREMTEGGARIDLTLEQVEAIASSPDIPMTTEEKEKRLLRYLFRNTEAPEEAVGFHPLSRNFNISYSANLQEFVYVMEKLRENELIVREGSVLKLTEMGWSMAASYSGGGKRKACCVLAGDDELGLEWISSLVPGLEQCGYSTRLFQPSSMKRMDDSIFEAIAGSKLIVADLTGAGPEIFYAAGFAARAGIPVVWTVYKGQADNWIAQNEWIRPLPWESTEELVALLQQKL
ncbi:hypothetical protein ACFQZE_09245 [Paenibacillus sp. GCM10027627]|uniref:hypothetical protein n=1 Tax=unclassified Paenibacillus TaxID=185978 RepID=UPI0036309E7F